MKRTLPFLAVGVLSLFPLQSGHAATKPTAHKPAVHKSAPKTKKTTPSVTAHTYTGQPVDMQWGTVQVQVTVKGKKIVDVQATAPTERQRSAFINQQAVPWLRSEVLQAQSANIDLISGATMTSDAFAQSLQDALHQAHLA